MKLKTINIKGKSYVQVNERLKHFREIYQHKFGLTTEILEMTEKVILIKATITCQETGFVVAEGTAMESKDAGFINKDSHIENCETSAWGRALGNFGIGLDSSVSSYEESANWNKQQDLQAIKIPKPTKTLKVEKPSALPLLITKDIEAFILPFLVKNQKKGIKWCGTELRKLYIIDAEQTQIISKEYHKLTK